MRKFRKNFRKTNKPDIVLTRDGREARIVCWDKKGPQPILALVTNDNGAEETWTYSIDGKFLDDGTNSNLDLMFDTKIHEGWVNVYKNVKDESFLLYTKKTSDFYTGGKIYDTEEQAKKSRDTGCVNYVCTIPIRFLEK